jgi:hypothetical protein
VPRQKKKGRLKKNYISLPVDLHCKIKEAKASHEAQNGTIISLAREARRLPRG